MLWMLWSESHWWVCQDLIILSFPPRYWRKRSHALETPATPTMLDLRRVDVQQKKSIPLNRSFHLFKSRKKGCWLVLFSGAAGFNEQTGRKQPLLHHLRT
ncbi:hypothetical protein B0O99DRAFT_361289 [Bisporella sp. PMI_857]|nr:hypothetical protein B0O99DRAFT_361289 [Bisporella sp. PMI_857]